MNFFQNKHALITGGSSGIGLALAANLVQTGSNVTILARTGGTLEEAAQGLITQKTYPTQVVRTLQADVTNAEEIYELLTRYVMQNGCPDIVVNCAGVAHPGTFTNLKPDIFKWMMQVNYFGTVNVLKTLVPFMQKKRAGNIVNISSIAGFIGVYGYTAYGASKFAVSGFTDALRAELKPYKIQVSIVYPPDTQTPQLDYEKKYKPFITQQIAGSSKLMTSEAVAREISSGMARKKYLILPGFESKLFYFAHHFAGGALYPIMDWMVNNAIRKIKLG